MQPLPFKIRPFSKSWESKFCFVSNWIFVFAGMVSLTSVGCSNAGVEDHKSNSAEQEISPSSEQSLILLESNFAEKSLLKGMTMQAASENLEFLGWRKLDEIRVSSSGMTNLWILEPCRAASIEYSQTYKTLSTERPPKHLMLNAHFYECVGNEPINLGLLAEINIKEDPYAKN